MEPISITAFVVAVVGAIGTLIAHLHMRKCRIFGTCCESDCTPTSQPPTPKTSNIKSTEV